MSYLPFVADENTNPTLRAIKDSFGFVLNYYRAQTIRPDLVDIEAIIDMPEQIERHGEHGPVAVGETLEGDFRAEGGLEVDPVGGDVGQLDVSVE